MYPALRLLKQNIFMCIAPSEMVYPDEPGTPGTPALCLQKRLFLNESYL